MSKLKLLLVLITFALLLPSCKKENQYNPDQHITYRHVYGLKSNSSDTLYSVYIPTAFTPNSDGINDEFFPKGYFNLTRFQIYNKWGKMIFETTNSYKGWNGSSNVSDKISETGAYDYKFVAKDANENDYEYTGSVLLCK